ncbi:unnamed protein product [Acanthoscelides obtectus]|uniref:Myosin light chain alkali n=1 Tax=Acanthoscelides obtectus TaxID=200917 RepID=A0A9P0KZZ2_ACAOB|nr:unnamed protein product [Acanthoscelides obtectus]CAK1659370.1 Myosin light chain alkali [Acanthoscelides obtectus]
MAMDLKPAEKDTVDFAFEVFNEGGTLDASTLPQLVYCCDVNPSIDTLEKMGYVKKHGEKKFKLDELYPIVAQLKKEVKDQGCYDDFVECLKLYDKNENGLMLVGELSHSFMTLGEKMTEEQVDELFEDCLDEEDDDGQISYIPFLRRMCSLDPPLKKKK